MKGNRHTEPQRGVSERNRRKAAALSAEMGSLSRSITRRSGQNCKIKIQNSDFAILQAACQKKSKRTFFDKLSKKSRASGSFCYCTMTSRTVSVCSSTVKRTSKAAKRIPYTRVGSA